MRCTFLRQTFKSTEQELSDAICRYDSKTIHNFRDEKFEAPQEIIYSARGGFCVVVANWYIGVHHIASNDLAAVERIAGLSSFNSLSCLLSQIRNSRQNEPVSILRTLHKRYEWVCEWGSLGTSNWSSDWASSSIAYDVFWYNTTLKKRWHMRSAIIVCETQFSLLRSVLALTKLRAGCRFQGAFHLNITEFYIRIN